MEYSVERCAGEHLGRHPPAATAAAKTLTFATTTAKLTPLGDWLVAQGVDLVGMESTGLYWRPVDSMLEERIPRVWLLNAEHLHNAPGRKTDVADSAWIPNYSSMGWSHPASFRRRRSGKLRDLTRHPPGADRGARPVIQRLAQVLQRGPGRANRHRGLPRHRPARTDGPRPAIAVPTDVRVADAEDVSSDAPLLLVRCVDAPAARLRRNFSPGTVA